MRSVEQRFAESEAVILDVDCVLVSSLVSVVVQSMQMVQAMRGTHASLHQIMKAQEKYVKTTDILEALVHPTPEEWPRVRELHRKFFAMNSFMPPIGDPAQFAQDLSNTGRKVALWTSRPSEFLSPYSCPNFVLEGDDPFRLFDAVSAYQGGATDKPHPDSLRHLAKELQVAEYDKIVVVEDMPQNIQVAQELGMLTVGVLTGISGPEISQRRMDAVAPDLVLPNYEALRPYLMMPQAPFVI